MFDLFPDQLELIDETRQKLRDGYKRILIRAETGFGKTIVSCELIRLANQKGRRCGFMVPRKQLLKQTSLSMHDYGIKNYSYIASGKYFSPRTQNYIISLQSYPARLDKAEIDVLFVDECHYGGSAMDSIINYHTKRGTIIIGLSATPEKQNGQSMGCWYDTMVEGRDLRWLIDNNRLSDYRVFVPHTVSTDGLRVVNGDFSKNQVDDLINADRVMVGSAIDYYRKHAFGNRHLTFAQNIRRSKELAEAFTAQGVPSAHMDADCSDIERTRIINQLADGKILNICSVDLLLFGFDLSAQVGRNVPIESISDCRLTYSRITQRQKTGRVLRYKDYPAKIFDHVGNALPERHGLPCAPVEWSLAGNKKKRKPSVSNTMAADRAKQCMKCYMIHAPAPACPNCGYTYPTQERIKLDEIDGELIEIDRQRANELKRKKTEEALCRTLEDWQALAQERGYKQGWAYRRWQLRNNGK